MHETGVVERHHDVECMTPCKPHFKDTAMEQPFSDLAAIAIANLWCLIRNEDCGLHILSILDTHKSSAHHVPCTAWICCFANTMISDISNIFKYYQWYHWLLWLLWLLRLLSFQAKAELQSGKTEFGSAKTWGVSHISRTQFPSTKSLTFLIQDWYKIHMIND